MSDQNQSDARVAAVRAAEDARCKALVGRDMAALRDIISPDMIYVHTSGKIDNAASLVASYEGPARYLKLERRDLTIRVYGQTAVMNGVAEITGQLGDDSPKTIVALVQQVWVEEAGRWRMVAYQGTKKP